MNFSTDLPCFPVSDLKEPKKTAKKKLEMGPDRITRSTSEQREPSKKQKKGMKFGRRIPGEKLFFRS